MECGKSTPATAAAEPTADNPAQTAVEQDPVMKKILRNAMFPQQGPKSRDQEEVLGKVLAGLEELGFRCLDDFLDDGMRKACVTEDVVAKWGLKPVDKMKLLKVVEHPQSDAVSSLPQDALVEQAPAETAADKAQSNAQLEVSETQDKTMGTAGTCTLTSAKVFLSYRVRADAELVERLFDKLRAEGVDVWWDKKCLPRGQGWEEGFANALGEADIFVPVLSKQALAPFETLETDSGCDNVLLEYQMALDLKERGALQAIFPVLVGELREDKENLGMVYNDFFKGGGKPNCPETVVEQVETKLANHLGRLGKGAPVLPTSDRNVKRTLERLLAHQGVFLNDIRAEAEDRVVAEIVSRVTVSLGFHVVRPQPAGLKVFISYRVKTDADLVERLYDKLRAAGVDVWWDKKCLPRGQGWEEGFANALGKSDIFVPVLSKQALAPFEHLQTDSSCDNVLLEYQMALDLKERGALLAIFPVFVGELKEDKDLGMKHVNFFDGGVPTCPDTVVDQVERKMVEHLGRLGKGSPVLPTSNRKVKGTLNRILEHQGVFLKGIRAEATDRVVAEIVKLAKPEEGQANMGPKEALSRKLAEKQHDKGYYLYIVIQRPPVVAHSYANQLRFRQLIDDFEDEVKQSEDIFVSENAYPICVNDGDASTVMDALKKGEINTLVLCGTGRGWEAPSESDRFSMESLVKAKQPKMIVLVLKYGARQAAEWLFEKIPKETVVVCLQADVLGSHGREWLSLIAKTIMDLHRDTSNLEEIVDNLKKKGADLLTDFGDRSADRNSISTHLFGTLENTDLRWKPKEETTVRVFKQAAGAVLRERTNITNLRKSLLKQRVLSCDLTRVEELKQQLQKGVHSMYFIDATDDDGNKRAQDVSRCMSVALSVLASFALNSRRFQLVYYIEKDEDLKYVKKVLSSGASNWNCDGHILLWAHLQDKAELTEAEEGLDSSWSEDMSTTLAQICKNNNNARVIMTTDNSRHWGQAKCIEHIAKLGRRDSIAKKIQDSISQTGTDEYCYPVELETIKNYMSKPESCPDHDEIKIVSKLKRRGGSFKACDLLDLFADNYDALRKTLEDTLPQRRPIAGLYQDSHQDKDENEDILVVRISISDVGFLHELRDIVLDRRFTHKLTRQLEETLRNSDDSIEKLDLQVDQSRFVEMYEKEVLCLHSLTPHQKIKLEELRKVHKRTGNMHLEAPAGAGKTIVALHEMLNILGQQDENGVWQPRDTGEHILFVARNKGLAHFVVRWLWHRFPRTKKRRSRALSRLHLLVEKRDSYVGPQQCVESENRITLVGVPEPEHFTYTMLVVDEAHHVYGDPTKRAAVEKFVTLDVTQMLLLSDISQSVDSIEWPKTKTGEDIETTRMTEVVRNSQRIVVGAAPFQLGENKTETTSFHKAPGPPLKSYIFDQPQGSSDKEFQVALDELYVERTIKALADVISDLPNLSLDDRLAFIVKNRPMVKRLHMLLEEALSLKFPTRSFKLVDAETASSRVDRRAQADKEWLVLDEMANFDGLERLIVLCIGLDSEIEDPNSNVRETRSLLYRAFTRAHMIVAVINEKIEGGFLEFLTTCRLEKTEKFDQEKEKKQVNYDAVDKAISSAFEKIMEKKQLHKDAIAAIKAQVADQIGAGKVSTDDEKAVQKAISAASDEWARDQKETMFVLQERATALGFTFAADENQLRDKTCARAVVLWRSKSDGERHETVRAAVLESLLELVSPRRLITWSKKKTTGGRELSPKEADALSKHRISIKLRAEPPVQLQQACEEAICEWNDLMKETIERTGQLAKELEPADWPVDRSVVEQLPALAALEVVQQGRQAQEVMEMLRSVLKAAQTEGQILKEGDLLKLSREVSKTISTETSEAIAKVLLAQHLEQHLAKPTKATQPTSQTIWDTAENTAKRGDDDPKFVPFVSKQNQGLQAEDSAVKRTENRPDSVGESAVNALDVVQGLLHVLHMIMDQGEEYKRDDAEARIVAMILAPVIPRVKEWARSKQTPINRGEAQLIANLKEDADDIWRWLKAYEEDGRKHGFFARGFKMAKNAARRAVGAETSCDKLLEMVGELEKKLQRLQIVVGFDIHAGVAQVMQQQQQLMDKVHQRLHALPAGRPVPHDAAQEIAGWVGVDVARVAQELRADNRELWAQVHEKLDRGFAEVNAGVHEANVGIQQLHHKFDNLHLHPGVGTIQVKGKCTKCGRDVLSTQQRGRGLNGEYFHADPGDCAQTPVRTGHAASVRTMQPKGTCPKCGKGVYNDQARREEHGVYFHADPNDCSPAPAAGPAAGAAPAPAPVPTVEARLAALVAARDWRAGAALEAEGVAAARALRADGSPGVAGAIFFDLGVCLDEMGQPARALPLVEQARAAYAAAGDTAMVGRACHNLGNCHNSMGQYAKALPWYEQARAAFAAAGDTARVGKACLGLGVCHERMGQYAMALPLLEQARAASAAAGDTAGVGQACEGLGTCHFNMGQDAMARPWYEQARAAYTAAGDTGGAARVSGYLADCAARAGRR